MKIYTKKGDKGKTSLIGGTRVPKYHLRIEAYGTVDELNSYVGLIRDHIAGQKEEEILKDIQDRLFTLGSMLASDPEKSRMKIPELVDGDVELLEKEMDRMNEGLPELTHFVLPGGHPIASYCHLARCVCRRAERLSVHLNDEEHVEPIVITYLNRLSDYFFVLARLQTLVNKGVEYKWIPKM